MCYQDAIYTNCCKLSHCNNFSANTAQEEGDRRKRTSDLARTRDLNAFAELQPRASATSFSHELSVSVTNPLFPIALCTGCRCAAIQRPLEDLRLEAGTVCDGNGLSGRQRVAWTREPVVDGVSCLCLAMLVQVLCEQVEMLRHTYDRYIHKVIGGKGFVTGTDSSWLKLFFFCRLPPEQCLKRSYYNVSTCSQRT